jgi:hypothetical protein
VEQHTSAPIIIIETSQGVPLEPISQAPLESVFFTYPSLGDVVSLDLGSHLAEVISEPKQEEQKSQSTLQSWAPLFQPAYSASGNDSSEALSNTVKRFFS